jgi:hypothetical protein
MPSQQAVLLCVPTGVTDNIITPYERERLITHIWPMQTTTKHMRLRGPCRNHRWCVHDAVADEGHERGSSRPHLRATCHWLIAKVTSMSLNRFVEEPKSDPTAEHSRRNPLTKPTSHVTRLNNTSWYRLSSGKHNMRLKNRMQLRNHWACKESWFNSCKRWNAAPTHDREETA